MSTTNEPLLSDNKLNWTDVSGSRHQMAGWQVREIYEAQRTADRALIQALVDALAVLSASAGMGANLIPDDELKRLMRDGDSTTRLMMVFTYTDPT